MNLIYYNNNVVKLDTKCTTYAFRINAFGHLEHLYYGRRIEIDEIDALICKDALSLGNVNSYSKEDPKYSLPALCLEFSGVGKGDVREPLVEIEFADGSRTCDFVFESADLSKKQPLTLLPASYDEEEEAMQITVHLVDRTKNVYLDLIYGVFEECDVITRSAKLYNKSDEVIRVKRLLSACLDFEMCEYELSTFGGSWTREMKRHVHRLTHGKVVNTTRGGISGNRNNPFIMVYDKSATEDLGDCYGFNLIYSGNHYEACEVSEFGQLRVVTGISPECFSYDLTPLQAFEAPEAVLTYSSDGMNGMSHNMHDFVRNHIVRGEWKKKERPILLNSWEASYFDINEDKLLDLAKKAKETGIELFVMDDGWFGERNDETSSLGDWYANSKKLPGGLKGLADKINALGLEFGLWVEPEMVNEKSELYKKHPDWAVKIPGREHSEGRHQMLLDLTKKEVRDYIVDSISNVLESANISYVKWDMNRNFTDEYSDSLPSHRQTEFNYWYQVGLYDVLSRIMSKFPNVLFEGCASGGNRFDLGMLCYFTQIWASDNTDGYERASIQTGYSYGYPMSTVTAHVSGAPNHQTLRVVPLETRFNVAAFGVLGYECNFLELSKEELAAIRAQVAEYKKYRKTLQYGDYYRIENGEDTAFSKGIYKWITVSKEKDEAFGAMIQGRVIPNYTYARFKAKGLDDSFTYEFTNRETKLNPDEIEALVCMGDPLRAKKDSYLQGVISMFADMNAEKEHYRISGSALNYAGVRLKQGFGGLGYNEQIRFFGDYQSRLYIMKKL